MEVFIVFFINFQGEDQFSGVFSSENLAIQYISRFAEPKSSFKIEPHIVDSE